MLCRTEMRNPDAVLGPLTGAAMLVALYLIFIVVPTEAEMGIVQRIFYFHVASAWVAFLCFFTVAGAGAVLLWRGPAGARPPAPPRGGGGAPFFAPPRVGRAARGRALSG